MSKHEFRVSLPTSLGVDKDNRTISGVTIAEQIEIKDDRRLALNDEFMQDFVTMAKGMDGGIKSEYGHNWDGSGKKLGKIGNVTFSDSKLIGDLQIYTSADLSPKWPNLGNYVLSMVDEDSESYMLSMKVSSEYLYGMRDGKKAKVNKKFNWELWDYEYFYEDGKTHDDVVFMKLAKINGVDVVSEGAFTNSMFSTENHDEVIERLNLLCETKGFNNLLQARSKDLKFFDNHYKKLYGSTFADKTIDGIKALFGSKEDNAEELSKIKQELDDAQTALAASEDKITALTTLAEKVPDLKLQVNNLTTEKTRLTAEITTLKSRPPAEDARGDEEVSPTGDPDPVDSFTAEAKAKGL